MKPLKLQKLEALIESRSDRLFSESREQAQLFKQHASDPAKCVAIIQAALEITQARKELLEMRMALL